MKTKTIILSIIYLILPATYIAGQTEFIKGVDISYLQQIENLGGKYTEDGIEKDALDIFKDHNVNYIRLRLWHAPTSKYNNLDKTLLMAQRIKEKGFKFLLNFHYSDTWADPAHQTKPAAWAGLSFPDLKDSVYQYTSKVIQALKGQNTLPGMVQIGNEINCGMIWNEGRVCDSYNTTQQWDGLAELINEGIRGVKENLDAQDSVKIMIHNWDAGDNAANRWFLDRITARGVDFDIIGQSYYPWWHGNMSAVRTNLNDLAQRYDKEIIIVEAAYPWTLSWYDNTNNIVGLESQLHPGYPASVEGQKTFLIDLIQIILEVPEHKGAGIFYWAPEYISVSGLGSSWENLTLFSFQGEVLNSITAFDSIATSVPPVIRRPSDYVLFQNYPNPFNSRTIISWHVGATPMSPRLVDLSIYNLLGQKISMLVSEKQKAGSYKVEWDASTLPSGVYLCRLRAGSFTATKKLVLLR